MGIWNKTNDKGVGKTKRTYRRLVVAGSIIALLAVIVSGLASLLIFYALSVNSGLNYVNSVFFYIISLTLVESILFIAILIFGLKLKTGDSNKLNRLSKEILVLSAILLVLAILAPIVFKAELISSVTPLVSGLASQSSYNQIQIPSFTTLIISILYYVETLGWILVLAGSLFGLAKSKDLGLFGYLSRNKKLVIIGIISISVIIGAAIMLTNYKTSIDNKMALQQLNSKIYKYGTNVRLLLQNKSLFVNETNLGVYQNISVLANNQSSLNSVLLTSKPNLNLTNSLNSYDWYESSPLIRGITITTLFSLGIPVVNQFRTNQTDIFFPQHYQLIVPSTTSNLESLYELKSTGELILVDAVALGNLFGSAAFNPYGHTPYNGINISAPGFVISMTPEPQGISGIVGLTSILNKSNFYDDASLGQFSGDWISLAYAAYDSNGKVINATTINNLFYSSVIPTYVGYLNAEILYNTTIPPNIDLVVYQNNTTIISLGNLNLSNPQVKLYFDGNQSNYTRFWDFLVVKNKHLSIGQHEILVTINNLTISQNITVSPDIIEDPMLSAYGYLYFSIPNSYNSNITIYNFSVVRGLDQEQNLPPNLSGAIIGTSNHSSLTFYNATYYRFNFFQKQNYSYGSCPDGLTNCSAIIANYTPHAIHNNSVILKPKDYLALEYSLGQAQTIGEPYYFTVKYDTSYGPATDVIIIKVT